VLNELTVIELIRLIIPKLIRDINIHEIISVIFFFASFTSAHLEDSIIHITPLKITIVTDSTIVILKSSLAILTINGACVVPDIDIQLLSHFHHNTSVQKALSVPPNDTAFF
jgi:hypothetical protein